jgi:DNA-binding transcriptional MocR family regulator
MKTLIIEGEPRTTAYLKEGPPAIPGGPFFVDGSGRNTMRLTFAKEEDGRIREGMGRWAELFG